MPKPGKQEFTVEGACFECMHMGWAVFNDDSEVQRCDNCSVFKDDDAALAHIVRMAKEALKTPRRRSGKRFKEVLMALEIAAEKLCPPFWIGMEPNPDWLRDKVAELESIFTLLDGATGLSIAYMLQDEGFIHSPSDEDEEANCAFVQENLDHDELENILFAAGIEKTPEGNYRVKKGKTG